MTRTRGARERRWRGGAAQLEGASPGEELEVEDESGRERGGGAVSMVVFMCSLDKSSADDGFYDILYLLIFLKKYANSFMSVYSNVMVLYFLNHIVVGKSI